MTGIETLIALMKILVPLGAIIFSAILKFLWDIKSNSKEVQKEFQTFKIDFTSEINSLKNKIDILDGKTKDSYSRSETDNLLLKLKNEYLEKMILKRKNGISEE
jgi:hypothetical protein